MASKKVTPSMIKLIDAIDDSDAFASEKLKLKQLARNAVKPSDENAYKSLRSLGWRWPVVAIVALSITCFCICWVKVEQIQANKDVRVTEITQLKR